MKKKTAYRCVRTNQIRRFLANIIRIDPTTENHPIDSISNANRYLIGYHLHISTWPFFLVSSFVFILDFPPQRNESSEQRCVLCKIDFWVRLKCQLQLLYICLLSILLRVAEQIRGPEVKCLLLFITVFLFWLFIGCLEALSAMRDIDKYSAHSYKAIHPKTIEHMKVEQNQLQSVATCTFRGFWFNCISIDLFERMQ